VTENSDTRHGGEADQPPEPIEDRELMDEYIRLLLEADDQTPEEAGYGHGV
jgi:hypothetical protein